MKFRIDYRIEEEEWAKTKELRGDPESDPIYWAFFGDVTIAANGQYLFKIDDDPGSIALRLSAADLAVALVQMLMDGFPYSKSQFLFREGDDCLRVDFQSMGSEVVVSCNRPGTGKITVGAETFSRGVYEFLQRFVREIEVKVPDVFSWKDLSILADVDRIIRHHKEMVAHR